MNENSSNKRTYNSCCMCGPIKIGGISCFKFPNNPVKKAEWLKFCDMKPEHLKQSYKLCSRHFSLNSLKIKENVRSKQRLKPDAIPTIHCENFWDSDDSTNEKSVISKLNITSNGNNNDIANIPCTENDEAHEAHAETLPSPVSSPLHEVDTCVEEDILYVPDPAEDFSILEEIITHDDQNRYPKKKRLSYAGDVKISDLCSPERAQKCFEIYKKQLMTYKKKNKKLRMKLRRADIQNKKYKEIIKNLREQLWE